MSPTLPSKSYQKTRILKCFTTIVLISKVLWLEIPAYDLMSAILRDQRSSPTTITSFYTIERTTLERIGTISVRNVHSATMVSNVIKSELRWIKFLIIPIVPCITSITLAIREEITQIYSTSILDAKMMLTL